MNTPPNASSDTPLSGAVSASGPASPPSHLPHPSLQDDDLHAMRISHAARLDLEARLAAIENSTVWRLSAPLRHAIDRTPAPVRRYVKVVIRMVRRRRGNPAATIAAAETAEDVAAPVASIHTDVQKRANNALAHPITFPHTPTPRVSIIIPTYGQDDYTLNCLAALSLAKTKAAFEVIVFDDAYPHRADNAFLEERVSGARLLSAPTNLGFVKACNAAAAEARGDYLFFLNNDTEVVPGAIDTLVTHLDTQPDVGLVGSKLLYPNGQLQEAGGIIWQDASGWNWGRNQDPTLPQYCYRREVDYISGAAIMVRKPLFDTLGGFDEAFAPAYYEDTDLAFRIRKAGMKVMYDPRSCVVHYEGISNGTDIGSGIKRHQALNATTMRTRWQAVLDADHGTGPADLLRARDRARHRPIILVIDHYVPEPDRDAGSRTLMGVLRSLLAAGWVVKFWPRNRAYSETYTIPLEDMGIEVIDARWKGELADWLLERQDALDHVLVSRPIVAMHVLPALLECTAARLSLYGHDIHSLRMRREAAITGDPAALVKARSFERDEKRLWRVFDSAVYLSEAEAEVARTMEPRGDYRVVVPYSFPSFTPRTRPARSHTLLMVAGFAHPPNVDAATYLVTEILPLVLAQNPQAQLILAGSNPSETVKALAGPHVTVTGWLSEAQLAALYTDSRVVVAPLRFGAGVKGKTAEALREGIPAVLTPIAAEGIDGLEAITPIHESATAIAEDILQLLKDDTLWLTRSHAQTAFAEAHFSEDAMRESVIAALLP